MYYTYVLRSKTHGTLYIGSSEDSELRLTSQHNKGKVRYTKGHRPWQLIYREKFSTRSEAMRQEKYLKSGKGRELLKIILQ